MTARYCRSRKRCPLHAVLAATLALVAGVPALTAAVHCDDKFKISNVPTIFDGLMFDTVVMSSRLVTLETATFAQWRPLEDAVTAAALTLHHLELRHARVEFCHLTQPGLPRTVEDWKKYQQETAAAIGEGTIVSDQLDTTVDEAGVRVLGWDTREARFTRSSPTGAVLAVQFHCLVVNGERGLRIVLTAPPEVFESALDDLRFWLSRVTIAGGNDS